jgi:hypothetical protein
MKLCWCAPVYTDKLPLGVVTRVMHSNVVESISFAGARIYIYRESCLVHTGKNTRRRTMFWQRIIKVHLAWGWIQYYIAFSLLRRTYAISIIVIDVTNKSPNALLSTYVNVRGVSKIPPRYSHCCSEAYIDQLL